MNKILLLLSLVLLAPCAWCQEAPYFPERYAAWETMNASDAGFTTAELEALSTFAREQEYLGPKDLRRAILEGFQREPYHSIKGPVKERGGPTGMILKNGYLLHQWGTPERVDMTFSVTKSFLSTVAGLAYDEGRLRDPADQVSAYLWDGTFEGPHNEQIRWEHLLHQTSDWSGTLWGLPDWADRPPREGSIDDWKQRPLREPGSVMEYNDVRVNVLAYALTHLWRQPVPQVLKERIMDPIGATPYWRWHGYEEAWTEIDGLKMKSVTGGGHSGGGLFINAQDMARFGLLFMNGGRWKEKDILSAAWIDKALTPSSANPNYGYMWWLNREGPRQWDGVPERVYYAAGFGGNFIVIDPQEKLVVVLRWLEPSQVGEFMKRLYQAMD